MYSWIEKKKPAVTHLDEGQIKFIQVCPFASQVDLLGGDPDGDADDEVPDT